MSEVENKRKPRDLKGKDIYLMTSLISKIGVRNVAKCMNVLEVQEALRDGEDEPGEDVKAKIGTMVFVGFIDLLMEKMEDCEGAIRKLLSRLYDMPEAEVDELDANDYLDMIIDIVKGENFADFFKRAYESLKRVM